MSALDVLLPSNRAVTPSCSRQRARKTVLGGFINASSSRIVVCSRHQAGGCSHLTAQWAQRQGISRISCVPDNIRQSHNVPSQNRFNKDLVEQQNTVVCAFKALLQLTSQGYHTLLHTAVAVCLTIAILLPTCLPLPAAAAPVPSQVSTSAPAATVPSTSSSSSEAVRAAEPGTELGSNSEDLLKEAARQLESKVESALDAFSLPSLPSDQTAEEAAQFDATAHEVIREVWQVVDENYLDARKRGFDHERWAELRDQALSRSYKDRGALERAVKGMLAKGLSDPYSRYVPPKDFEAMAKYDVTGIGLNLGTAAEFVRKTAIPLPSGVEEDDTGIWVVGIIIGSPADKAGVQQGDRILAVDGQEVGASSPFQVASIIQGGGQEQGGPPPAAKVSLKVQKYAGAVSDVTVGRSVRTVPTPVSDVHVEKRRKRGTVGYVRLSTFNARAQRDLSAAIRQLEEQGVDEFVLDLRDNYGGLVSEGIEIARLFLGDNAPIVYTKGQRGRSDSPLASGTPLTTKPLTVLVNEHSASASEILAGALQDNCRAVLVGKKTYGKGIIQSVYALTDGSGLVTTVGKYLTPNLTDIDQSGIKPDFDSMPAPEKRVEALNACRVSSSR